MGTHMHRKVTDLDSVSKLLTVLALDLGPVLGLKAVPGEVALLLAITAGDTVWVAGLVAFLRYVILGTTVAASPRRTSLDIGALKSCQ